MSSFFEFEGAANLPSPPPAIKHKLTLHFDDANHITEPGLAEGWARYADGDSPGAPKKTEASVVWISLTSLRRSLPRFSH